MKCFFGNIISFRCSGFAFFLVLLFCAHLSAEEPAVAIPVQEIVLIKNVQLIDHAGVTEDQTVNILIIDRILDIVTKDAITEENVTLVVDVQQGVLVGKLDPGILANFMIFDKDPRGNTKILLDTKTYAYFAVDDGVIVLNRYKDIPQAAPPKNLVEPKTSGWLAYTPPPQTLSSRYPGSGKWNTWDNDYFNGVLIGAILLDRQNWLSQNNNNKQQVGDLKEFDGGEVRAFRLGLVGQLKFKNPWIYTIFAATNSFDKGYEEQDLDRISFMDIRLDVPLSQKNTLSVGKQKEPISMERLMTLIDLPMTERAGVSDALFPSRNFGVVLNGNVFSQRLTWALGGFNDWFSSGENFNDADHQVVGRVTCLPILSRDGSEGSLAHLGLALRYSDASEGLRYRTEPEFNKAPIFTDTGLFSASSSMTYNLEATLRHGPVWLAGEFTRVDVDAPQLSDPTLSGSHLTLSWIMTGEMRPYRKTSGIMGPITVARSIDKNGWGAWEAAIRWSELDMNDGLLSGGEMDILSLGLNCYLTDNFRVSVNYRNINLDKDGLQGESHGVMTRLLLML